ncbi:MAG: hypothetical protein HUJ26_21570 [Planctomycetaceae bacterium]|nr:hypothetical protein [Planctomycetaceae bacterium]
MFRYLILLMVAVFNIGGSASIADVFEQHTSQYLRRVADSADGRKSMTLSELHQLQPLSNTETTPVVILKTSEGQWTKAAMTWAFRKTDNGLIPILTIERFVTYRDDLSDVTAASGSNIMLFSGFSYDFDIGQVVPADQGGDLTFTADDKTKSISLLEGATVWGMDGSQLPEMESKNASPTDHSGVIPTDFAGIWNISIDGRWAGTLRLKIDKGRILAGTFTSNETKSTYEVFGRVASPPQHAKLTIQLDNAQQDLETYLWTKDKSAMAGVSSLAGQTFGFYATRETDKK